MQVAGYVRVSTEQQRENDSHVRQREKLQGWADQHGHDIEFFEDIAVSGQADDRPAYDEMMVRAAEFDAIAVRELSRFGRSLKEILRDIEQLDEHDTDFVSLEDPFDTQSAQGKLIMQIIGAFNEFWANLARERAEEMVQRRKEKGKPVGRPRKVTDGQLEQIREWREQGLSYSAIATLVEDLIGEPIDESTIYRYCNTDE